MDLNTFTLEERNLIKICTDQAKYFLNHAGEFFPFAVGFDQKKEFHPIGVYLENEHPDSIEVLSILYQSISKGIADNKYLLVGICADVYVSRVINSVSKKLNAIEIKIVKLSSDEHVLYIPYEIAVNKTVNFGEFFT